MPTFLFTLRPIVNNFVRGIREEQGRTVHKTEVIDKLDEQKNILKTNLHTEKQADRKKKESLQIASIY